MPYGLVTGRAFRASVHVRRIVVFAISYVKFLYLVPLWPRQFIKRQIFPDEFDDSRTIDNSTNGSTRQDSGLPSPQAEKPLLSLCLVVSGNFLPGNCAYV